MELLDAPITKSTSFGLPNRAAAEQLLPRSYPQVIKYMGSKAGIIDFVVEGIREAYNGGPICDLFAGACSLSGALGHLAPIVTDDIQTYSKVIAHAYLHPLSEGARELAGNEIIRAAEQYATTLRSQLPSELKYPANPILEKFNIVDKANRALINAQFKGSHHLFVKFYSGTWWSAERCVWIDALRHTADNYLSNGNINQGDHCIMLTCIMHAMAYCGQGTGHYAQYRDAKDAGSLADINLYRQKSIAVYFSRKWESLKLWNTANVKSSAHRYLALDYLYCIDNLEEATIYADPPYAFVHYSRFYHAIETFVLYDYPGMQIKGGKIVKGRYREDRHQSPFSIRSLVPAAFESMFQGVSRTGSNLVLSYSNTGLFKLPEMFDLANSCLDRTYKISVLTTDHTHMTMGRRGDRNRDVEEALLIAVRK